MRTIVIKNLIVQFDTFDNGADQHTALDMVDAMNDVLRQRFPDASPIIAQSTEYDCTEGIREENISIKIPEDELTHEMCPHCEREVELEDDFRVQTCPSCKCPILPCSICEDRDCAKCPLETEEYRSKLIDRAMVVLYKDDDPKYDAKNRAYLETLSNTAISIKIATSSNF